MPITQKEFDKLGKGDIVRLNLTEAAESGLLGWHEWEIIRCYGRSAQMKLGDDVSPMLKMGFNGSYVVSFHTMDKVLVRRDHSQESLPSAQDYYAHRVASRKRGGQEGAASRRDSSEQDKLIARTVALKKQGFTAQQVADTLHISYSTVFHYLKKAKLPRGPKKWYEDAGKRDAVVKEILAMHHKGATGSEIGAHFGKSKGWANKVIRDYKGQEAQLETV